MNRAADQAYLRTRLAIMYSRLLGPDEIEVLIELPIDALLERLHLQVASELPRERLLDRFEQALLQVWLDEMSTLLRPLHGAQREILVQWARRYELYNLKALIRGKLSGQPAKEIRESLFRLPGFLSLDHDELLQTDDIAELLRRLDQTPYRSIAHQAQRRFAERRDPFLLDATLDQHFYTELSRRVPSLDQTDRSEMNEMIGRIVDRHNIIWMLRYRYNYSLGPAEALYLSIDHGFRLSHQRLARLIESAGPEEFIEDLPEQLNQILKGAGNFVGIEARLQADIAAYADRVLQRSPSAVAAVFAYLILRYYEIKTLFAIAHSRIVGLDNKILREALHPDQKEAA